MEKEFLYVGHYIDNNGIYILKIGTTNDLKRRAAEHRRNYKAEFVYDWYLPLSKYNTIRYEDKNRTLWQNMGIGEYIRNDRFRCAEKPSQIVVKIRKEYIITL